MILRFVNKGLNFKQKPEWTNGKKITGMPSWLFNILLRPIISIMLSWIEKGVKKDFPGFMWNSFKALSISSLANNINLILLLHPYNSRFNIIWVNK
ncbi:hypothetical protein ALO_11479 [Acetonema longum DSM 6540]|uniref:Uncharacterized protein n=1 Tax=Acetonema longum DSM 6540 TaxID=1009370 RepID=F7NJN8_9FIRM|nr:hypothetical protein ALO_11479 [Acetonema longum DSM 6540]